MHCYIRKIELTKNEGLKMIEHKNCKICKSEVTLINETYNLGQCKNCKLIFCLTIYSQDQFIAVYDELYNKENAIYRNHAIV